METLVLLAFGGLVFWLIARSMSNRRLIAEAERRQALATFEIDRSDANYWDHTQFDFASMQAQHRWDDRFEAGKRKDTSYALRRKDGGWEWRMTPECWTEHMKWLAKQAADPMMKLPMNAPDLAEIESQTKRYASGPVWEPLSDAMAAPLETAYQRYVRQG